MIRIDPNTENEPGVYARFAAEQLSTDWSESLQRAENLGDDMAGVMETAVCRVAVIVALWFGH